MQNQLSPQNYIATKARSLPFKDCYISEGWEENGMATIFLTKLMPSGNYIFATYLVVLNFAITILQNVHFLRNIACAKIWRMMGKRKKPVKIPVK